jgi:hypothetical protein
MSISRDIGHLIEKAGRWLLKERNETADLLQSVTTLLEALVTTGD